MEASDNEGYYFRDEDGEVHGPMSKSLFERAERKGTVLPGARAWRIQGGSVFVVTVRRRFLPGNICSWSGGVSCCDLGMSFSGLLVILYFLSIPKNRNDILNNMQNNILGKL